MTGRSQVRQLSCKLFSALVAFLLLMPAVIGAQTAEYDIYIDTDGPRSGCSVNLPDLGRTLEGVDSVISASTDRSSLQVTDVSFSRCQSGVFSGSTSTGGGFPIGLNNGEGGADVVELSAPFRQLGQPRQVAQIYIASENLESGAADLLETVDGQIGGNAIFIGLPFAIPVAHPFVYITLALFLLGIGLWVIKRGRSVLAVSFLLLAGLAFAATFTVDGDVTDWVGVAPVATDPAGDASLPDNSADIVAVFAMVEDDTLFLRVDVVDAENTPPVATAGNANGLEDNVLTLTLSGTDVDGDALTFSIDTPPSNGVLGAITQLTPTSAQVDYTPNMDFNGADTFNFVVNDGQVGSMPAAFDLTIAAVNDVPEFTPGGDVTVLEDSGAADVSWASNIMPGPATATDESGQLLTFNVTGNTNAALFSVQPMVDAATGNISFTPAADANGTANITVELMDDGGTANGGVDTTAPVNFMIIVTAVNDAPVFTGGGDVTVLEDSGAYDMPWATGQSAGPADESGQILTFNVTANDNPSLFSVAPAIDATTGNLSFTTATDAAGTATVTVELMDDGGTADGGVDTSAPVTLMIDLTAVNDAPEFTPGGDLTVLEDSGAADLPWATNIQPGPATATDEAGQILTFNVTANSNNALFSVQPTIDPVTGNVTFTPAPDANGTANLTVALMDDGGTANGGADTSASVIFAVNVTAVNDAPGFNSGGDATVLEDSGAYDMPWATGLTEGPPDESAQTLVFNVTGNTNPALFSVQPAVDGTTGNLSFTVAADAFGTSNITIELMDNGGTANGGADTSTPMMFAINVTPVNDAPGFISGGDVGTMEDAGPVNQAWATGVSAGPANESGQTLTFNVTGNTNPGLFAAGPAVDAAGNISFTTNLNAFGTAAITVELMDNGGTANGGIDTTATVVFNINLLQVNDPPVFTSAPVTSVDEDSPYIYNITTTDVDPPADTRSFMLVSNPGWLNLMDNGDGTASLTGTPVQGNVGLNNVTLRVTDTGPASVDQAFTITVNEVNDPPVVAFPGAALDFVEGDGPSIIDGTATASDIDSPNFMGGSVTVSLTANGTANDRLGINSEVPPNPPGTGIEISGSDVLFNGNTIGSFSGGTDGSTPLVISLTTAQATPTAVQALLRNLTFDNVATPPTSTLTRTATITVDDGDGGASSGSAMQSISVATAALCDGVLINNVCWFLGNNGESCDTVCGPHGGYNAVTETFAGSGGTDAQCESVLTALGQTQPSCTGVINPNAGGVGCGVNFQISEACQTNSSSRRFFRDPTQTLSTATGGSLRRACACNDQPPPVSISYAGTPFSLPRGIAIAPIDPTVNGFVATFSINPALPAGLTFDTTTGRITGTPTVNQAATSYMITGTNAAGSVQTTISIAIIAQPPQNLAYPNAPFQFNVNNAVPSQLPTVTGQVDTYGISPPLPAGLTFDSATGEIAGTPTATQGPTNYTVTATNADGTGMVTISIEVTASLACDGTVLAGFCWHFGANGQSCDTVCSGRGGNNPLGTTDYAGSGGSDAQCIGVLTALGQTQPSCTGVISPNAGGVGCGSNFQITEACQTNGSSRRFFRDPTPTSASATGSNLRRACACNSQPAPMNINYANAPFNFTQGVPITPQVPSVTNVVINWMISPPLPAGLIFNASTGEISGNPTALQAATNHTVTASNAGGSTNTVISVAVVAAPPMNLDYPTAPFTFNVGTPIAPQLPTVTGTVTGYSINPALPAGLTFSTATGAIGGNPNATSLATNYTVTATNASGMDTVMISITVNGPFTCAGTVVGGACWYFGANNQSCDQVCSTHGGYNNATETFAGSGGSGANCVTVLNALGQTQPTCTGAAPRTGLAVGCAADFDTSDSCQTNSSSRRFVRYSSPATNSSASSAGVGNLFLRRACACNN